LKKINRNFDGDLWDFDPCLRGPVPRFACGLFGIGSAETTVGVSTTNAQNTIGNAAAQSSQAGVGGGNKVKGQGQIVTNISTDPQTLLAAENSVNSTVAQAFQFGAQTETIAAQTVGFGQQTINALAGQISGNPVSIDPTTGVTTSAAPFPWTNIVLGITGISGVLAAIYYLRK
jgi:hypothetical protein